jgi:hypothetical protein
MDAINAMERCRGADSIPAAFDADYRETSLLGNERAYDSWDTNAAKRVVVRGWFRSKD